MDVDVNVNVGVGVDVDADSSSSRISVSSFYCICRHDYRRVRPVELSSKKKE